MDVVRTELILVDINNIVILAVDVGNTYLKRCKNRKNIQLNVLNLLKNLRVE